MAAVQAARAQIGNILAHLFLQRRSIVRAAAAERAATLAMAERAEVLLVQALLVRAAAVAVAAEELSLLLQPAAGPLNMSMVMQAVLGAAQACSV